MTCMYFVKKQSHFLYLNIIAWKTPRTGNCFMGSLIPFSRVVNCSSDIALVEAMKELHNTSRAIEGIFQFSKSVFKTLSTHCIDKNMLLKICIFTLIYTGGIPQQWHSGLHYCHTAVHTNVTAVTIATSVISVVVTVLWKQWLNSLVT